MTSNIPWATAKGKHGCRLWLIFSLTRGYNFHTSFLRHDWIPVGNLRIMKITINHIPVDFSGHAHENVYVKYALNSFGELRQKLKETWGPKSRARPSHPAFSGNKTSCHSFFFVYRYSKDINGIIRDIIFDVLRQTRGSPCSRVPPSKTLARDIYILAGELDESIPSTVRLCARTQGWKLNYGVFVRSKMVAR